MTVIDADVMVDASDRPTVAGLRRRSMARSVAVGSSLAVLTAIVFCWSLSVGDFSIPVSDVIPAIFGNGSGRADFIIGELRLPRAITAVLVGAAFGMSGAIFQSLAGNPLASPDVIGITTGASASAVFVIVVIGGSAAMVTTGALVGALVTAVALYGLAYKRGVSSYRLVLIGIGIGAMCTSVISYLLTRAEIYDAQKATVWLTGSLNGRTWTNVREIAVACVVLVPIGLVLVRPLRAMQLGDDTAKGLGVRVERARAALIVVAVLLSAVSVAAAGPITFVAFVAPPIARRLVRTSLTILPAAVMGAFLLVVSDLIARRAFAPRELPVGVITSVLGAPYLLWLLARANRVGRSG